MTAAQDLHRQLEELIEPTVTAAGFALVRVRLLERNDLTLQIMAEDPATGQMTIDQCAALSHSISELLDTADPIEEGYVLEVSSPGIDRPLTRPQDYARWAGHLARISLHEAIPAGERKRRRFRGQLLGIEGDKVRLRLDDAGDIALALSDIAEAKLLLTDRLIAETAPQSADAPADDDSSIGKLTN